MENFNKKYYVIRTIEYGGGLVLATNDPKVAMEAWQSGTTVAVRDVESQDEFVNAFWETTGDEPWGLYMLPNNDGIIPDRESMLDIRMVPWDSDDWHPSTPVLWSR